MGGPAGGVGGARLALTREQILAYRRWVGCLDERLAPGPGALRRVAWAGLQDSMPRAALLSIHARMAGTHPSSWEDPALVQLWGPRFSVYAVAAEDLGVFSLGLLPDRPEGRERAERAAGRLHSLLGGERMEYDAAGRALGVHPNSLRYAAATGRVLLRWDGARRPVIWTGAPPPVDPREARLELARRYLHVFGPTTPSAFATWSGVGGRPAVAAFGALGDELVPVSTPQGDAWILAADEATARAAPGAPAQARLLPSGDAFLLLQGEDRALLVPDPTCRELLWPSRVWPGGLLVDGEVAGHWRRAGRAVTVQAWRTLSRAQREAVAEEVHALPLPGGPAPLSVRWE